MSIVKSFSVGNGDMFYIKHGVDSFTIIDCNMDDSNREFIVTEIKECVEQALKTIGVFRYNEKAKAYRESLTPEGFGKKYKKIYEKANS